MREKVFLYLKYRKETFFYLLTKSLYRLLWYVIWYYDNCLVTIIVCKPQNTSQSRQYMHTLFNHFPPLTFSLFHLPLSYKCISDTSWKCERRFSFQFSFPHCHLRLCSVQDCTLHSLLLNRMELKCTLHFCFNQNIQLLYCPLYNAVQIIGSK